MNSSRIPEGLQKFLAHAEGLHPSNNPTRENGFAKEFMQLKALSTQLKKEPEYSSKTGELECNRPKNRYKDILPFDYNRIKLPAIHGIQGSDYINGNYVKGPDGNTSYLALQGPLPKTVDDFWRLIASHKCQIVIMVCKEVEMGKLKCKRYWPESKDEKLKFGGLDISLISENVLGEGFLMRTMKMKSGKEEMMVTQLQYTAWPDHDVPKSAEPLIEMNKTLSSLQGSKKQQVLVHCSAGCGRTGTICAVDYAWTLLKMQKTDNFSVFDIVANLRRQRMAMVQTKEQYALVYKAVVYLVQEELEKDQMKGHTYVNVPISPPPLSPQEDSTYENCEFLRSVARWKQSDRDNGSPRRSLPTDPKENKSDLKPAATNKARESSSVAPERTNDYVNLEFPSRNEANSSLSPHAPAAKPMVSVKPSFLPGDSNKAAVNSNAMKGGVTSPLSGRQQAPTVSDYEILPSNAGLKPGNAGIATHKNKGSAGDYEIPAQSASLDKKEAKHVPEGLLIDLGDDAPPLPNKRHSVGSATYENVAVAATSSADVDDWLLLSNRGLQVQKERSTGNDSKAFRTVPNRVKPSSGPKRSPLKENSFDDFSTSTEKRDVQSPTKSMGEYSLVGAASPTSQSDVENPAFFAQFDQIAASQKSNPSDKSLPKQAEKSKGRHSVGSYCLVGIPASGNQAPIVVQSTPNTDLNKQSAGVTGKDTGKPVVEPSYELVGQSRRPPEKTSPKRQAAGSAQSTGDAVEVNRKPSSEPLSQNVRQKLQQSEQRPRLPPYVNTHVGYSKGVSDVAFTEVLKPKIENDNPVDLREKVPESLAQSSKEEAKPVTDIYAVVSKQSKSTDMQTKFPGQSSSLKSCSSTSSDDSQDVPTVPEKTNESYLVAGEDAYENVEQSASRSTLGRFKKIIKSTSKSSIPKLLSDSLPSSLQFPIARSNSSGSGASVSRHFGDLGFGKRVGNPKGPRAHPRHWPQMNL